MKSIIALGLLACSGLASASGLIDCDQVNVSVNNATAYEWPMVQVTSQTENDGSTLLMFADDSGHQLVATVYKSVTFITFIAQGNSFSGVCNDH